MGLMEPIDTNPRTPTGHCTCKSPPPVVALDPSLHRSVPEQHLGHYLFRPIHIQRGIDHIRHINHTVRPDLITDRTKVIRPRISRIGIIRSADRIGRPFGIGHKTLSIEQSFANRRHPLIHRFEQKRVKPALPFQ